MPALLDELDCAPAAAHDIYATALVEGLMPLHVPQSSDKSALIDQAYSEYRNLCAAGVEVDPDAFCARFPEHQTSLRRLLEVHREIEANPDLLRKLNRWPVPGEWFYGFQLEHELGRGAFARVFLAREQAVGNRQVVVKVSLHAEDEADTLGKLQHPNVVPIHSVRFDTETRFAVVCMPFLGGATLSRVIDSLSAGKAPPESADTFLKAARDDRFSADSAAPPAWSLRRGNYLDGVLYLGERLASALSYIHERGILHRDLKPSNVLLCPNGEPVLIDFNLAHDRSINEHRIGGTLPYMPPEQLLAMTGRGNGGPAADNRSDLFALGVLLYELSAGAHPFGPVPLKLKTAEAREFLLERQERGPRPLRSLNRSIDPALDALITCCLSHDPAGRPSTARELVSELRRLQAPIRRARRWFVSHAKEVAVATVLLGSGATYGGVQIANLPSRAEAHKLKADQLLLDGNYSAAIDEFNQSLDAVGDQRDAKSARGKAYEQLGAKLYKDGKYQDAIDAFALALADHDDPAVHFARGRAFQKAGKWESAVSEFKEADPASSPKALASMAYSYSWFRQPRHGEAAELYRKAIRGGFTSPAILNDLSYALGHTTDNAGSEAAADDALAQSPQLGAAKYNRAMARFKRWKESHDSAAALDGLNDMRGAIEQGAKTPQGYFFASSMCAAVLHDSLDTTGDSPLHDEGAGYLRCAVESGYPLTRPTYSFSGLEHLAKWERQLPSDMKISPKANLSDRSIRLIDPVTD